MTNSDKEAAGKIGVSINELVGGNGEYNIYIYITKKIEE